MPALQCPRAANTVNVRRPCCASERARRPTVLGEKQLGAKLWIMQYKARLGAGKEAKHMRPPYDDANDACHHGRGWNLKGRGVEIPGALSCRTAVQSNAFFGKTSKGL